jgi:hypothetical protein
MGRNVQAADAAAKKQPTSQMHKAQMASSAPELMRPLRQINADVNRRIPEQRAGVGEDPDPLKAMLSAQIGNLHAQMARINAGNARR